MVRCQVGHVQDDSFLNIVFFTKIAAFCEISPDCRNHGSAQNQRRRENPVKFIVRFVQNVTATGAFPSQNSNVDIMLIISTNMQICGKNRILDSKREFEPWI